MRLFWRTYLCMLLRTYANVCVHRLCFWMGFFLQITSYLLPFGNAKSAIFLNDRLSNDTDQTFLNIYFFKKIFEKIFFKSFVYKLNLDHPDSQPKKNLIWIFIFTLLCSTGKSVIKVSIPFIIPFEGPQIIVKAKIYINFFFVKFFWDNRA